jgi:hypothetical protein
LEAGDKPFEGVDALRPIAEATDISGKVVVAKLEEGAIDLEAKGGGGDGMCEVIGKVAKDRWVMERTSEAGDSYVITFLCPIKAMVTRGMIRGAAKRM